MNVSPFCTPLLKEIALGILLTASLFGQAPEAKEPPMAQQIEAMQKKAKQTMAVNNLRQIGLALFEFETEYGSYPNAKTAALVKENSGTKMELKAGTADDCFRQLIAANILQTDEVMTLGKIPGHPEAARKPGKWIFAYAAGLTAAGNPSRPLAFYPMIQGKTTFDPEPIGGKAVILFIDNSVKSFPIEKDGTVRIDGKDMFDPAQGYWGGKALDIKWPAK